MRSIEFLREEGPGNDQPMSDAEYAAQRAQGEKNLNAVKGFFGSNNQSTNPSLLAGDDLEKGRMASGVAGNTSSP